MQNKTSEAESCAVHPGLHEAEDLVQEVRRLLVHSENTLDKEGIKNHAQTLERWLESYRRGLAATQKISENGNAFLLEMRQRLSLSLEEMQRLEDEGGATPATKEQKQRMDDLTRAIQRIDQLTASLSGASFTPSHTEVA